jgi:3-isopropylmalate/(R)-2-methylmalate dehydratase small subunit
MALPSIVRVAGRAVHVPGDDVDTDQIIPARFMRCVTFDGLGAHVFHDLRCDAAGQARDHPFNRPERRGAVVLVAGFNFGCGSSREHAPQALHKSGIRAIVAGSFAEIFFGNATALGLPCVTLDRGDLDRLARAVDADPRLEVAVNLAERRVSFPGRTSPCAIREAARRALLEGQWDPIALLLEGQAEARELEAGLAYLR